MITDKVQEMLLKESAERNKSIGEAKQRFDNLVQRGLIQKREYDIPPVNVLGPKISTACAQNKK